MISTTRESLAAASRKQLPPLIDRLTWKNTENFDKYQRLSKTENEYELYKVIYPDRDFFSFFLSIQ